MSKNVFWTSKHPTSVLIMVLFTSFETAFTSSAVSPAIPSISETFHSSASLTGWIITCYMLPVAALTVPFGRIADLTGRLRILMIGIIGFMLSSFVLTFSVSIEMMLVLRVLQGIFGAAIFSTNMAMLINAFSIDKRGKMLGVQVAVVYFGLSVGPVCGGAITHFFSWHYVYLFTSILGVPALIASVLLLRKKPEAHEAPSLKGKFDALGNIEYIIMLTVLIFGLSNFANLYLFIICMALFIALFIIFIVGRLKLEYPIIKLDLFKHLGFSLSNIAALFSYGATFATTYILTIYLQYILDFSPFIAGLILIIQPAFQSLFSPIAGHLSDKISPFKVASFGMAINTVALVLFIVFLHKENVFFIMPVLALMGIGFGIFSSPNTNAAMSEVDDKDMGLGSSILATMRNIGFGISMAIVTASFSFKAFGKAFSEIDEASLLNILQGIFIIFACICFVGIFISVIRGKE